MDSRFVLTCDCLGNCGSLVLIKHKLDEDMIDLYVEYHQDIATSLYKGPMTVLFDRIKQAWSIMRGKSFLLYGIVIKAENMQPFLEWINKEVQNDG